MRLDSISSTPDPSRPKGATVHLHFRITNLGPSADEAEFRFDVPANASLSSQPVGVDHPEEFGCIVLPTGLAVDCGAAFSGALLPGRSVTVDITLMATTGSILTLPRLHHARDTSTTRRGEQQQRGAHHLHRPCVADWSHDDGGERTCQHSAPDPNEDSDPDQHSRLLATPSQLPTLLAGVSVLLGISLVTASHIRRRNSRPGGR